MSKKHNNSKVASLATKSKYKEVVIRVIEAKDLIAGDSNGKSDPFVELIYEQHRSEHRKLELRRKTKVVKRTLTPRWNESFRFIIGHPEKDRLTCEVKDKDLIGSDKLGHVTISFGDLLRDKEKVVWLDLHGVARGQLCLGLTAVNFGLLEAAAPPPPKETTTTTTTTFTMNTTPVAMPMTMPVAAYPMGMPMSGPYPTMPGSQPFPGQYPMAGYPMSGGYPMGQPMMQPGATGAMPMQGGMPMMYGGAPPGSGGMPSMPMGGGPPMMYGGAPMGMPPPGAGRMMPPMGQMPPGAGMGMGMGMPVSAPAGMQQMAPMGQMPPPGAMPASAPPAAAGRGGVAVLPSQPAPAGQLKPKGEDLVNYG